MGNPFPNIEFLKVNQEKFRENEDYWKDTCTKWLLDLDIDEIKDNLDKRQNTKNLFKLNEILKSRKEF